MKTAYILIFSTMIIVGGLVLSHSITEIQPVSSAPNNTPLPTVYILPTETPTPIIPTPTIFTVPTEIPIPTSTQTSKVQIIKATYGPPFGFVPTELTVKVGVPVRLEVYAAENGRGCMGSIMLPELLPGNIQGFTKGETDIFEFTPQTPGTYQITCAMGIPHGQIIVK